MWKNRKFPQSHHPEMITINGDTWISPIKHYKLVTEFYFHTYTNTYEVYTHTHNPESNSHHLLYPPIVAASQ